MARSGSLMIAVSVISKIKVPGAAAATSSACSAESTSASKAPEILIASSRLCPAS